MHTGQGTIPAAIDFFRSSGITFLGWFFCGSTVSFDHGANLPSLGVRQRFEYTVFMYSLTRSLSPLPATASSLLVPFLVNKVTAGFPSPAEDLGAERLDLSALLVPNPQATFYASQWNLHGELGHQ